MTRPRLLALALLALAAVGCSTGEASLPSRSAQRSRPTTTSSAVAPPTTTTAAPEAAYVAPRRLVAGAKIPWVAVFDSPDAAMSGGRPASTLRNPTWEGYRLSFLVEEARPDGWLRVNVPVRPNGTVGWIQSNDVDVTALQGRVEISLSAHRLRYWEGPALVLDEPVALGTARTPTPPGSFFVDIIAQPPSPRGPYGPYQVSITAFSDVLERFAGGIGQLAIHGTNRPDLIGQRVSNGCIRLSNAAVTILAERVAIGTPVDIVA